MSYKATSQFEQYVVGEFDARHKFETNHLAHHQKVELKQAKVTDRYWMFGILVLVGLVVNGVLTWIK